MIRSFLSSDYRQNNLDIALLILRVGIGSLMLVHGLPKLTSLMAGGPLQFPGVFGMSPGLSLALTVFAEVVASVFIIVGLGTRLATIPLIITMLVAVFFIHSQDPFAKQELGLLYLLPYVLLLITGGGRLSLDGLLWNRKPALRAVKLEKRMFAN